MRAKFISDNLNEVSREEDYAANLEIDNYLSTKENYPLEKYIDNVVNYIWNKLKEKMSQEELNYTNTTKESIEEMITYENDSTGAGFFKNIFDYYQEGIGFIEAGEELYDECYTQILAQGWTM